jgi:hypothetical protein
VRFLLLAALKLPLLAPAPDLSIDRDLPPPVKERILRVQKELMQKLPACRSVRPPSARITARALGHQVEVKFSVTRLPTCPAQLVVVTYSGAHSSATYNNYVEHYWLTVPRGRVVLRLPFRGRSPYHVIAAVSLINGRRGPETELALRCPPRGCTSGDVPTGNAQPVSGVSLAALQASFEYAVSGERRPPIVHATPRSVGCSTLRACTITYVDPAFPSSPYRVRYRIAGERANGCWLAVQSGLVGRRPFEDAFSGRLELGACVSWLR